MVSPHSFPALAPSTLFVLACTLLHSTLAANLQDCQMCAWPAVEKEHCAQGVCQRPGDETAIIESIQVTFCKDNDS